MKNFKILIVLLLAGLNLQGQSWINRNGRYAFAALKALDSLVASVAKVDSIQFADGTWQKTAGGNSSGSGSYTGNSPATVSVGGISAGDPIPANIGDILELILAPWVQPQFTHFDLGGAQVNTVEVGDTLATRMDFRWGINDLAKIAPASLRIVDVTNSNVLANGLDPNTGEAFNTAIGAVFKNAPASHSWRAEVTDLQANNIVSANYNINWRWKRYYGWLSNTTPSNADIIALVNEFSTSRVKSYTTTSPSGLQHLCFFYPSSFGDLSNIKVGGLNSFGAFTKTTVAVTNAAGGSTTYNFYYSNNTFSNSVSIDYE